MTGYLHAEGIHVQRDRIRVAMRDISDANAKARKISRRVYKVPTPNSLWHVDGHMKLIRWGITTHGCIDSYSRLITFLKSSTNNTAEIVFNHFLRATLEYGLPSCVRSDHGSENRHVALFMNLVTQRHITGRSVHNQRTECLWRDVHEQVTSTFYQLFYELEDDRKLDVNSQKDILALTVVYLPEINKRLHTFQCGWNQHGLRTEGNKTPEQLWMGGTLQNANKDNSAIRGILSCVPLRQQLEQGLLHYNLTFDDFNDIVEMSAGNEYVLAQNQVQHLVEQNLPLEEKFHQVKAFLLENQ